MNPLYQQLTGRMMPQQRPVMNGMQFQNPIQKMQYIMQAMTNPAAFVRNAMPDLPAEIANDPNRILQWMQQNKGVTNEQIQAITGQMPRF